MSTSNTPESNEAIQVAVPADINFHGNEKAGSIRLTHESEIQSSSAPGTSPPRADCGWAIAVPWILTIVMPIITFILTRRASRSSEEVKLIVEDVKQFLSKMEEFCPLVSAHQSGSPANELESLEDSRKLLTKLRKEAATLRTRVEKSMTNEDDRMRWEREYLRWKESTEGDTGLITNRRNKWSDEATKRLEHSNSEYIQYICKTRNWISSGRISVN